MEFASYCIIDVHVITGTHYLLVLDIQGKHTLLCDIVYYELIHFKLSASGYNSALVKSFSDVTLLTAIIM